eukprot:gene25382-30649_t
MVPDVLLVEVDIAPACGSHMIWKFGSLGRILQLSQLSTKVIRVIPMDGSRVKAGAVTDAQGRKRFHGAFTGGFSAGYYNTVGSEEGFKPTNFRSSRSDRAQYKKQRVQDYMDEDDGLLGGVLSSKEGVDSFKPSNKSVNEEVAPALFNIIIEPSDTMGKKLLGLLGWKAGQGIGPRTRKKEYFEIAPQATFAPADTIPAHTFTLSFLQSHTGYRGVGFDQSGSLRGYDMDESYQQGRSGRYRVQDILSADKKLKNVKNNQISQKRGLGGLGGRFIDEEDDDIAYDNGDAMDADAYTFGHPADSSSNNADLLREADDPHAIGVGIGQGICKTDNRPALGGFAIATQTVNPYPYFPPPSLPKTHTITPHVFPTPAPHTNTHTPQTTSSTPNATPILPTLPPFQRVQERGNLVSEQAARPPLAPPQAADAFRLLTEQFKSRFTSSSQTTAQPDAAALPLQGGLVTAADLLKSATSTSTPPVAPPAPSSLPGKPFTVQRSTQAWAPAALLCKRCNRVFGKAVDVPTAASNSASAAAERVVASEEGLAQRIRSDVYVNPAQDKPALAFFQSIFNDSDSDSEDDNADSTSDRNDGDGETPRASASSELIEEFFPPLPPTPPPPPPPPPLPPLPSDIPTEDTHTEDTPAPPPSTARFKPKAERSASVAVGVRKTGAIVALGRRALAGTVGAVGAGASVSKPSSVALSFAMEDSEDSEDEGNGDSGNASKLKDGGVRVDVEDVGDSAGGKASVVDDAHAAERSKLGDAEESEEEDAGERQRRRKLAALAMQRRLKKG